MFKRLKELVNSCTTDVPIKSGKNVGKTRKLKTLGGKGKLTGSMIDKLSRYFRLAIQRNHDSVENMRNAIWATYDHYSSTDENPHHERCPSGADSWCKYQKTKATTGVESYYHKDTLPKDVLDAIKPIYEDLTKEELLKRCLGGFTQNNNESLNKLIWTIAPKKLSGSFMIVEIAARVSASLFNEGNFVLLNFLHEMGVNLGPCAHAWAEEADSLRIQKAEKQAQAESKEARILRRQEQQAVMEENIAEGNVLYGAGIDDSV